jgi:hypothetical protein
MVDKKKQLVWNIIDFLKTSQQDGTVKEDDKESLDVASELISRLRRILLSRLTLSAYTASSMPCGGVRGGS